MRSLFLRSTLVVVVGLSLWAGAAAQATTRSASELAAPEVGNPRAMVRVVIFEDLECPDCARWNKILQAKIIPHFASQVRFEMRDYPLPQHPWAFNAAVLARFFATHDPQLYFAWRDDCFTHQDEITTANLTSRATVFAAAHGIAATAVAAAFNNTALFAAVRRDHAEGARLPVKHTPTVLVGPNRPGGDREGDFDPSGLVEATSPRQLVQLLGDYLRSPVQ